MTKTEGPRLRTLSEDNEGIELTGPAPPPPPPSSSRQQSSPVTLRTPQGKEVSREELNNWHINVGVLLAHLKRQLLRRQNYWGLLVYSCFIIVFLATLFSARPVGDGFRMGHSLRQLFSTEFFCNAVDFPDANCGQEVVEDTFDEVIDMASMWEWITGPFKQIITTEHWYNGWNFTDPQESNVFLHYNRLVGRIRLRQLRVKEEACDIPSRYRIDSNSNACYEEYDNGRRQSDTFGAGVGFRSQDFTTSDYILRGQMKRLYDNSGYVVDLPRDAQEVSQELDRLRDDLWTGVQTRALVISFPVYNWNINLFSSVQLLFEFTEHGFVFPSSRAKSFKLVQYDSPGGRARAVFEITFLILLGFYWTYLVKRFIRSFTGDSIELGLVKTGELHPAQQLPEHLQPRAQQARLEADRKRRIDNLVASGKLSTMQTRRSVSLAEGFGKFFASWWNVMDFINLLLFVAYSILRMVALAIASEAFDIESVEYTNLQSLADIYYLSFDIAAFCILLSFLGVFRFFQYNFRLYLLWFTIAVARFDLLLYLLMFSIVYFGYALMGHVIFGHTLAGFSTFASSASSLGQMVLGEFDYDAMRATNRWFAPLFFISYMILVFFALINMFLAIVNEAYASLQDMGTAVLNERNKKYSTQFKKLWSDVFFNLEVLKERIIRGLSKRRNALMKKFRDEEEGRMRRLATMQHGAMKAAVAVAGPSKKQDLEHLLVTFLEERLELDSELKYPLTWDTFERILPPDLPHKMLVRLWDRYSRGLDDEKMKEAEEERRREQEEKEKEREREMEVDEDEEESPLLPLPGGTRTFSGTSPRPRASRAVQRSDDVHVFGGRKKNREEDESEKRRKELEALAEIAQQRAFRVVSEVSAMHNKIENIMKGLSELALRTFATQDTPMTMGGPPSSESQAWPQRPLSTPGGYDVSRTSSVGLGSVRASSPPPLPPRRQQERGGR